MSAYRVNTPMPVPERVTKVMALLTRAVNDGDLCPTNSDIATVLGAKSMSTGADVISLLETMALITVERSRSMRVVTIVATGLRTAGAIRRAETYGVRGPNSRGLRRRACHWTSARDAMLMDAIADDRAFASVAIDLETSEQDCSERFDLLAAGLGYQAA